MPTATPEVRHVAAQIGRISDHDKSDARLPGLRARLAELRAAAELRQWAARNAAALPPLCQPDIEAVAAIAARLDARIAKAKPASAA
jgi:hypothetical protein